MENQDQQVIQKATQLIEQDFSLDITAQITEEELIAMLADHIYLWIREDLERLFSVLYRLDVPEHKVHYALNNDVGEPANVYIARLVVEREKQKARTRLLYSDTEGDGSW